MLTAARRSSDVVSGLQIGADDYLSKPFAIAELVARIRSLARRAEVRAGADSRPSGISSSTRTRSG